MRVSILFFLAPFLASNSLAAVVQKTLTLSDAYRAPDGFNRSCVSDRRIHAVHSLCYSVTLINGQEIGPVIVGQVVSILSAYSLPYSHTSTHSGRPVRNQRREPTHGQKP